MLAYCRQLCSCSSFTKLAATLSRQHEQASARLPWPSEAYGIGPAIRLPLLASLRTAVESSRQVEQEVEQSRELSTAASSTEFQTSIASVFASQRRGHADVSAARLPFALGLDGAGTPKPSQQQSVPEQSRELSTSSSALLPEAAQQASTSEPAPVRSRTQVQNPARPPWTPTRQLQKRNFLPRRMGHLMQVRLSLISRLWMLTDMSDAITCKD